MSDRTNARSNIFKLLDVAKALIPNEQLVPLQPSNELLGAPSWYRFEHSLWAVGENIRQLFAKYPTLREDRELQKAVLEIACDRRAHRGRQPFVMFLGYKTCSEHAPLLSKELDDPCVAGHVISTLYLMKARGYSGAIRPFAEHPKTWIRNEAKRYCSWDAQQNVAAAKPRTAAGPESQ